MVYLPAGRASPVEGMYEEHGSEALTERKIERRVRCTLKKDYIRSKFRELRKELAPRHRAEIPASERLEIPVHRAKRIFRRILEAKRHVVASFDEGLQ